MATIADEPVPSTAEVEREATAIRQLWLAAVQQEDLVQVERRYRRLIKSCRRGTQDLADPKYRVVSDESRQRLVLLLAQQGRDKDCLTLLGKKCVARLAPCVLNYPTASSSTSSIDAPCVVFDDVLPNNALEQLDKAFLATDADYWTAHSYCVEPPTPYFSYVVEVCNATCTNDGLGALGALIRAAMQAMRQRWGDDHVARVKYAELWAHNRPHPSGHQMHFDSDDEGRGGVRNPIVSCVLCLTTGIGGPTLVANQRLGDAALASKGWIVHPRRNRLTVFDGTVLHGVIPGKGVTPQDVDEAVKRELGGRRVTVMLALWEEVTIRPGTGPGSARPLPDFSNSTAPQWLRLITGSLNHCSKSDEAMPLPVNPIDLPHVWSQLDDQCTPWPLDAPMPGYERAFQGF